jgi:hypothetical protein
MGYLQTKEHKEWAKAVKERDGGCIVCGAHEKLTAHHLIPKEFKDFRSDTHNGVCLCAKHHMRFGLGMSPHSHGAILFFLFLQKNKPYLLHWVEEHWNGV